MIEHIVNELDKIMKEQGVVSYSIQEEAKDNRDTINELNNSKEQKQIKKEI